jgi:hypothetical protein
VRVQLNAFDDQRETDEELTNHGPPGIDLSSHVDVFYAILGQVSDLIFLWSIYLKFLVFRWFNLESYNFEQVLKKSGLAILVKKSESYKKFYTL